MFCKFCGKRLNEGEVCQCPKAVADRAAKQMNHSADNLENTQILDSIEPEYNYDHADYNYQNYQQEYQQGYQQDYQQGYQQDYQPQRKKSHKGLIITLIVLGVILIAAGSAFAVIFLRGRMKKNSQQPSTNAVVESQNSETDELMESDVPDSSKSVIMGIKEDYDAGLFDYSGLMLALEEAESGNLSDADYELMDMLKSLAQSDLQSEMNSYIASGKYMDVFRTLSSYQYSIPEDPFVEELKSNYYDGFIAYLKTESERLVGLKQKQDAEAMLNEAKYLIDDPSVIDELIKNVLREDDYILPDSDKRYLTKDDVKGLSLQEINYAKNEIYARHGRRFSSKELQQYFDSKSWYKGTIDPKNFSGSVFNKYEKANTSFLSDIEFSIDSRGYQLDAH